MAIEIDQKPKKEIKKKDLVFLVIGIILLLGAASSLLFFHFFGEKQKEELEGLREEYLRLQRSNDSIEEEVKDSKKKIDVFTQLLQEHKAAEKFFSFMESSTHYRVEWNGADLNLSDLTFSASGRADSFITLAQQLLIFKSKPAEIESVELKDISMSEKGGTDFSVIITFRPYLFEFTY